MTRYTYVVNGTGADGQTWKASGYVESELEGDFPNTIQQALRESFLQLTQGKAIYGNPGLGECRGPYKITRLFVERQ